MIKNSNALKVNTEKMRNQCLEIQKLKNMLADTIAGTDSHEKDDKHQQQ